MVNDGGPAFPHDGINKEYNGMRLRDWLAGMALGHISQPLLSAIHDGFDPPSRDDVATLCYQLADAMLRAREK